MSRTPFGARLRLTLVLAVTTCTAMLSLASIATTSANAATKSGRAAGTATHSGSDKALISTHKTAAKQRSAPRRTTTMTPGGLGSLLPTIPGTWNLAFDDEFNNSSLNTSKWNPNWYGTSSTLPSGPVETTDEGCEAPSEVGAGNGQLSLGVDTTSCTTDTGKTYPNAGSLIDTWGKFQFTYGYMEARIYVPTTSTGQLVNMPAFWADGTGTWPHTGELDVMEVLNGCGPNNTGPGFGYHFISNSGNPGGCVPQDSTGGWHTFGADWEPGKVTYYYDGRAVGTVTEGITSSPMYLILDQTVNTTWGSHNVQSAQAKVDYVRVWQRAS